MGFVLSSSMITDLLFQNNVRTDTCPFYWKLRHIDGIRMPGTEAMDRGSYFEYITNINKNSGVNDLPRNKRNGNPKVEQQRLDMQAMVFRKICHERNIVVNDDTTQRVIRTPWHETGYVCPMCKCEEIDIENVFNQSGAEMFPFPIRAVCKECKYTGDANDFAKVVLKGTLDILSPFQKHVKQSDGTTKVIDIPMGIIDTKVTGNLTNTFGKSEYCWSNTDQMDLFQAVMYPYIFYKNTGLILPFAFLVFDYKPEFAHRWIHTVFDSDSVMYCEEGIRKALGEIRHHWDEGFIPSRSEKDCKLCLKGYEVGDGSCKFALNPDEQEIKI